MRITDTITTNQFTMTSDVACSNWSDGIQPVACSEKRGIKFHSNSVSPITLIASPGGKRISAE